MEVLKPAISGLGDLQIEQASVDNFFDINLAIAGLQNLSAVV